MTSLPVLADPASSFHSWVRRGPDRDGAEYDRRVSTLLTEPDGASTARAAVPDSVVRRLDDRLPDDGWRSWIFPLFVTLIAGLLRITNLSHPPGKIFDEVYYAKDANDLLHHGVELNEGGTAGGYVAHPPLGKWCIALGEWLFGNNEFGWRIAAVVAGTLSVLIVARLGRRLFRSTLLGCVAALLLTIEGLHFVSSRVALLDIFLMLFVLASFACLVIDRDRRRQQVLVAMRAGHDLSLRLPRRGLAQVPWWRFAAAAMAGAAVGIKWSAVWYVLLFTVLSVGWEIGVRRTAGVQRPVVGALLFESGWTAAFIGTVLLVYLGTWSGWLLSDNGWGRHAADAAGWHLGPLNSLVSLFKYHQNVLHFHEGLDTPHDYQSTPWSWLLLGRPVAYYYSGDVTCSASACSSEVIALGNPPLWWSFIPAIGVGIWRWLAHRDWRAGALVLAAGASIVPWMFFPNRTMFIFYVLPAVPFLILLVAYTLGLVLGPSDAEAERKTIGVSVVAAYVVIMAISFAYFYPIYSATVLSYDSWHARMWFNRWI
jgi:dolichyl-phosphate-mannose--protein O-mannosyl transferase